MEQVKQGKKENRNVQLPFPVATSILHFHTVKKNVVTDNLSFFDCLTMNY